MLDLELYALITIAALFAIWGGFKGAMEEMFSILGLGLAILLAPYVANHFFRLSHLPTSQQGTSFLAAALGTGCYIGMTRIGRKLHRKHIHGKWAMTTLDRVSGAILGGLKGIGIAIWLAFFLQSI